MPPRTGPNALRCALARPTGTGATALVAAVALTASLSGAVAPPAGAAPAPTDGRDPSGPPVQHRVTLVTGDVVRISTGDDGQQSVSLEPGPDGTTPQAAITRTDGHLFVVPTSAFGLLSRRAHRPGPLRRDRPGGGPVNDDASTGWLAVIVDYGRGAAAAAEIAGVPRSTAAERTLTVPAMLGVAAFHADKDRARAFWDDLTKDDADGAPDALADGAVRVDLDGRVEAALEKSVPRSTHPRHGRRDSTAPGRRWRRRHGLRPDPSRPGGQGVGLDELHLRRRCHGRQRTRHARRLHDRRHRRSVRPPAAREGVAREPTSIVGKVLTDGGWGADSWVLAGMQWAGRSSTPTW